MSDIDENLCSEHQGDDTNIYHACNIYAQVNIVIRCYDTDIVSVTKSHASLKTFWNVWNSHALETIRDVDLTKIYAQLGLSSQKFPRFHAITG